MLVFVNSIVEGKLTTSASASEPIATAGLGNLLRLHKLAGREVRRSQVHGEPAYEIRHQDGAVHAVHWLSPIDEGAAKAN